MRQIDYYPVWVRELVWLGSAVVGGLVWYGAILGFVWVVAWVQR